MVNKKASFAAIVFMSLLLCIAVPRSAGQVTFGNPAAYKVGPAPAAVAVGDFNGDSKMDLAVVNSGNAAIGDDGDVSILLGNGDGTFQPARNFAAGKNPAVIAVADFNHDGRLDLVVGNQYSGNAGNEYSTTDVLMGNGDGTFQVPIEVPENGGSVFVGDLNGDGDADLVLIESTSNNSSIGVRLGNGDGTFQPAVVYSVGGYPLPGIPNSIRVGDFNGDNKLDVAVGTGFFDDPFSSYSGNVAILLGNGDGTLQTPLYLGVGFVEGMITGDFNGDGRLDLAVAANNSLPFHPSKALAILLGNSDGTLTSVKAAMPFFPSAVGDVDGDGRLDLAGPASIALGKGDGTFQALLAANLPGVNAAADLNGDGLSDVLWVDPANNAVDIILNTTPGFTLKSSPSGMTVTAGGSATYTINVGQQNGFANAASLACLAPASVGIRCSLSPSSSSPGSGAQLTVSTTGPSAELRSLGDRSGPLYALCLPFAVLAVCGICLGSRLERKNTQLRLLVFCVLFCGLTFHTGCGGGNNSAGSIPGTPAGKYAITVMGMSGSLRRSTTVTLTVH
jgi:hypothetical protein